MGKPAVLLLNPPGKGKYFRDNYCSPESKAGYYWQPIDLLIQSGFLAQYFEVDVLDAIIEEKQNADVLLQLKKKPYLSVLALTGTASWPEDFELFDKIKKQYPHIILALSGNLALFEHRAIFEDYAFIDIALLDYTTADYTSFLRGIRDNLSSICYRNNLRQEVVEGKRQPKNFSYPIPLHSSFKNNLYHLPVAVRYPSTVVLSSMGCPHTCEFCVASEINYRYRDVENLMEELRFIVGMGFKEITFLDFMFDANIGRLKQICQKIIDENLDLSWYCTCRIDTLNEELLQLMHSAGCHTIQFGVESASQQALNYQQKRLDIETAQKTIRLCAKAGIQAFGNFIIGLPGQQEESMLDTGKFAHRIGCSNAVFSTLVPDVGTELRRKMIGAGLLEDKMTRFSSSDKIFIKPANGMSVESLAAIRRKVMIDFYLNPKFIFNNFIKTRSLYEFKRKVIYGLNVFLRV